MKTKKELKDAGFTLQTGETGKIEFLLNFDRYGYNIGIDDVSGKAHYQIENMVAAYHNRQKGCIENLAGYWTITEYDSVAQVKKDMAMSDCLVAWNNGMDRCQCGYKDCVLMEHLPETFDTINEN